MNSRPRCTLNYRHAAHECFKCRERLAYNAGMAEAAADLRAQAAKCGPMSAELLRLAASRIERGEHLS